jgi:hypothetical protein
MRLNFQLHPTEPVNYRGSYTTGSKGIVDIELAMYQSAAGTVITDIIIIIIAPRIVVITTTMLLLLLKLTVSGQEEGGLRS